MQPPFWPSGLFGDKLLPAGQPDDRRPPVGEGHRLGVVCGRLGQRGRQHAGAGLDERVDPRRVRIRTTIRPTRHTRTARTTCSSTTISRSTTSRTTRPARPAARICPTRPTSRPPPRRRGRACDLKPVSFVKPVGEENEHPGYASTPNGNDHLVELLQSIERSGCAKDTMVIVTYDEFGGQWDHVTPPGQGLRPAPHDTLGPARASRRWWSRRSSAALRRRPHAVRHDVDPRHDRAALGPRAVGTRDAAVNDLSNVFANRPSGSTNLAK